LVLRLRGGCSGYMIEVLVLIRGKIETFKFFKGVKTIHVKQRIYEKFYIPCDRQTLWYNNRALQDEEVYKEKKKWLLELSVSPSEQPRMGLGLGGNIEQQIEEDDEDPRIWDVANSQILNIQIINSFDFFALTGIIPPPTPIDAHTYAEFDLPFYKSYADKRVPSAKSIGGGGAFDRIRTVGQILKAAGKTAAPVRSLGAGGVWKSFFPSRRSFGDDCYSSDGDYSGSSRSSSRERSDNSDSDSNADAGGSYNVDPDRPLPSDLKILMLDVDDTVPRFKSVAEDEMHGDENDDDEDDEDQDEEEFED
jgi:hypothetical protein